MADLKTYDIFNMAPIVNYIRNHGEARSYRRHEHFALYNSITTELALVTSGAFAFSLPDHKGDRQILSFAFAGEVIGAYITAAGNTRRSAYDITAQCDSEVIAVPKEDLIRHLDNEFPGYRMDFTLAVASGFMLRANSIRCDSPEMRYLELLKRIPGLHKHLSMTAIASYLGITRETFARMRKKMREELKV